VRHGLLTVSKQGRRGVTSNMSSSSSVQQSVGVNDPGFRSSGIHLVMEDGEIVPETQLGGEESEKLKGLAAEKILTRQKKLGFSYKT